ncbi:MAG: hypothetical protein E7442_08910 [Ruminococcaceae bacterium]|nr:hypothetical protein [Oscillospiraceae bacterium]
MDKFKNMSPQKIVSFSRRLLFAGAILGFFGIYKEMMPVVIVAWACMAGAIMLRLRKYRCPHCGKYLERSKGQFCPHCGKNVQEAPTAED